MSESPKNNEKKQIHQEKLLELQGEARVVRKIVLIIFIVILLVISGVVGGGYLYIKSALEPVDPDSEKEVKVTIPIGSSPTAIANILAENGIVKNAKVFRYYTKFRNESGFQAGEYTLKPSMTFTDIISNLKTGKVMEDVVFQITIPEGKQIKEIAKIISGKTNFSEEEVLEKLTDPEYIEELMTLYPSLLTNEILNEDIKYALEGYLYPATYPFYETSPSLEKIIEPMISQTEKVIADVQGEMEFREFSPHELLTFASLIEEEATAQVDRDKISAVFYNRMKIDMALQTDPTVLYALGEHKDRVLFKDLEINDPFNTYIHKGLTPGPIANAGLTSIKAALNPADISALYFLAASDGQVYYSDTFEEHTEKAAKYIRNTE
ncbi:endolytic transglycosylase MltG [Bacillus sp. PS06]|uniref:endolytic transglycosylase MltG n=1 Tax=Bacillus sp. PS06 TaxID=2764176 RepID=UPI0017823E4D|nr:endolytic transglycosylase MltG [Bacillus sp. PS06]MBD8069249.1 endolytic transglycosylase MltG [Bacillus sp. PS06]